MILTILASLEPVTVAESTPMVLTIGAVVTLVSVAFGAGLAYAKTAARMAALELRLEQLAAKVGEVAGRLDAGLAAQSARVDREVAKMTRSISEAERECGEGDAAISTRVHRLQDIVQDQQVRLATAETHLGYDGRGQTTPLRPEPTVRPRARRDPDPGESR